jgi:hypothetical protein
MTTHFRLDETVITTEATDLAALTAVFFGNEAAAPWLSTNRTARGTQTQTVPTAHGAADKVFTVGGSVATDAG